MKCLEEGLFSAATVKPLDKVYDRETEKRRISLNIASGCLTFVSGLRRVGKTTLVRSVANSLQDTIEVYINFWEESISSTKELLDVISLELVSKIRQKKSFLSRIGAEIREAELIIGPFRFKFEKGSIDRPRLLIENVLNADIKLILILDEIQECRINREELSRFLSAFKDRFSPKASIFLMGSVSAVSEFLGGDEEKGLYGRVDDDIILSPFSTITAEKFLRAGFEECGVDVDDEVIEYAVSALGGFPGWLVKFGSLYVKRTVTEGTVNATEVLKMVEVEAKKQIFREIARGIEGKRSPRTYLRIMRYVASHGPVGPSDIARSLKVGTKQNVLKYLKWLVKIGILAELDGSYFVPDPVIRRVAQTKEFIEEVLKRLGK